MLTLSFFHSTNFIHHTLLLPPSPPFFGHIGRGRGRGLSNLPAWMSTNETVGSGSSSSGSATVEMTTGQFEDNEGVSFSQTLSFVSSNTYLSYTYIPLTSSYTHPLNTNFDILSHRTHPITTPSHTPHHPIRLRTLSFMQEAVDQPDKYNFQYPNKHHNGKFNSHCQNHHHRRRHHRCR